MLKVTTTDGNSYDVKENYDALNQALYGVAPGQLVEFTLADNRRVAIAAIHIVTVEDMDGSSKRK